MVSYDLTHLTQADDQAVAGPIQDDEALFLFALIRCLRTRRVLEIGGLSGYSAANFLKAVGPHGVVYTVDLSPVPCQGPNHIVLEMDAMRLTRQELGEVPLDLVFFDCHDFDVEMTTLANLKAEGLINDRTLLALHDTGLHPMKVVPWSVPVTGGWMHQDAERRMVNHLRGEGYEALNLHPAMDALDETMPARHGLSILSRNGSLPVTLDAS